VNRVATGSHWLQSSCLRSGDEAKILFDPLILPSESRLSGGGTPSTICLPASFLSKGPRPNAEVKPRNPYRNDFRGSPKPSIDVVEIKPPFFGHACGPLSVDRAKTARNTAAREHPWSSLFFFFFFSTIVRYGVVAGPLGA